MFDVWFDGARVEPDVMRRSETELQEPFNLPPAQASILVNGKSHRIKRGCSADEAQQLAAQFACWGAETRIEAINTTAEPQSADDAAPPAKSQPAVSFTLAAVGATIPTQPRDTTAPPVTTDHLQLESH
jgi:hypothetical protein